MIFINKHTMIKMLELSSQAYKNIQPVCHLTRATLIESKETDTSCFIKTSGNIITVSFRGTDSKLNWIYNFCFAKKSIPYGNSASDIRVHCGFLESYKSVRDKIHAQIPEHQCKIIVTGHSMGAALAVLCAVDLQYNFPEKDIEAYLFGCPRVGNTAFANSYNKRVFKTLRITNGNDIVTKLPPAVFGYRHIGVNVHTGFPRLPAIISFKQHTPQRYYRSLWKDINT